MNKIRKYAIGGSINIDDLTSKAGSSINPWGAVGNVADTVSGFLPANSAYKGKFGNITQGLDSVYDTASNVLMNVNPMIGGIMKAGKLLNQGISALGGGTDGMTRTDAWLSSNFLGLTPIGLINGLGGAKSDIYTRDLDIDANTGGSYQGFLHNEGEADYQSGKKYGLLSSKAREKANDFIANVNAQQIRLGTIEDTQDLNNKAAQSNQSFISARQQFINNGGMSYARAGREGMKFQDVNFAKKVLKNKVRSLNKGTIVKKNVLSHEVAPDISTLKKGGIVEKQRSLDELVDYVEKQNPLFWKRMSGLNMDNVWIPEENMNGSLRMSWSTDSNGNAIVYPEIQYDGAGNLVYIRDREQAFNNAIKNNDYIIMSPEEAKLFTEHYKESKKLKPFYDAINSGNYQGFYKDGGKVNVIPEGALHKNKHHLEEVDEKFEDVTSKGIPVITEENGEVKQHAEVEKEEIIFRLEVTKKLEELMNKGTDEAAIEAGKLLVKEILHNTIDNANIIDGTN